MFQLPIAHAPSASWLPSLSQAAASQLPCVTDLRSPSAAFTLSLRPKLKVLRGHTELLSRKQLRARMSLGAARSTGHSLRFVFQMMAAVRFRYFVQNARSQTIQSRKHQAVNAIEGHSLRRFATEHIELVSKNQDFRLKPCSRPEQLGQRACQQPEKIYHRERTSPDSRLLASRMRFPVGTSLTCHRRRRSLAVFCRPERIKR